MVRGRWGVSGSSVSFDAGLLLGRVRVPAVTRSARCASSRSGTGSAATTAPFIAPVVGSPFYHASRSTRTAASWRLSASTSASPGGAGEHHASSHILGARHRAPGPLSLPRRGACCSHSFAVNYSHLITRGCNTLASELEWRSRVPYTRDRNACNWLHFHFLILWGLHCYGEQSACTAK